MILAGEICPASRRYVCREREREIGGKNEIKARKKRKRGKGREKKIHNDGNVFEPQKFEISKP